MYEAYNMRCQGVLPNPGSIDFMIIKIFVSVKNQGFETYNNIYYYILL